MALTSSAPPSVREQLALLEARKLQYQRAALQAKRGRDLEQAKAHLRLAKCLEAQIIQVRAGRPLDLSKVSPPGYAGGLLRQKRWVAGLTAGLRTKQLLGCCCPLPLVVPSLRGPQADLRGDTWVGCAGCWERAFSLRLSLLSGPKKGQGESLRAASSRRSQGRARPVGGSAAVAWDTKGGSEFPSLVVEVEETFSLGSCLC